MKKKANITRGLRRRGQPIGNPYNTQHVSMLAAAATYCSRFLPGFRQLTGNNAETRRDDCATPAEFTCQPLQRAPSIYYYFTRTHAFWSVSQLTPYTFTILFSSRKAKICHIIITLQPALSTTAANR